MRVQLLHVGEIYALENVVFNIAIYRPHKPYISLLCFGVEVYGPYKSVYATRNVNSKIQTHLKSTAGAKACASRVLRLDWQEEETCSELAESLSGKLDYLIAAGKCVLGSVGWGGGELVVECCEFLLCPS